MRSASPNAASGHGDRVALLTGNRPGTLFGWFGANRLGAICAVLNPAFKPRELAGVVPPRRTARGRGRRASGAGRSGGRGTVAPACCSSPPAELARAAAAVRPAPSVTPGRRCRTAGDQRHHRRAQGRRPDPPHLHADRRSLPVVARARRLRPAAGHVAAVPHQRPGVRSNGFARCWCGAVAVAEVLGVALLAGSPTARRDRGERRRCDAAHPHEHAAGASRPRPRHPRCVRGARAAGSPAPGLRSSASGSSW